MLEPSLASRVGLDSDLPLQLLRRRHSLLRQRLDRGGLPLLLVIALPCASDLQAEIEARDAVGRGPRGRQSPLNRRRP